MRRSDAALERRQIEMKSRMKTYGKRWWIRFTINACPICGRGDTYRERIYNKPKPKDKAKQYDYNGMAYDWCNAL